MCSLRESRTAKQAQSAARLASTLTRLTTHELRVRYLRSEMARLDAPIAAAVLDQICGAAMRGVTSAREALIVLSALLQESDASGFVKSLAQHVDVDSALFVFCGFAQLGGEPQPRVQTDKGNDNALVPDYGKGRVLALGERTALARRPSRRLFDRLLQDPHPAVIRTLLSNPLTTEDDVVRLVAQRTLRTEVLREVARHPRWNVRRRVRMAIVLNPGTPADVGVPLVAVLLRAELRMTAEGRDTNATIRTAARMRLAQMKRASGRPSVA